VRTPCIRGGRWTLARRVLMDVGQLGAAGPAQFDWLIHFCGRPPGTASSPDVPGEIRAMTPQQRLYQLLWEQEIRGFRQFGTEPAMVCFSALSTI
jgi:hypothetical protein